MYKNKTLKCARAPITFRQWSRKSYAVFSSLNKVIKIGFLAHAVGLLITPVSSLAQTDTIQINNRVDLDEVVVTGERTPVTALQLSRPVTIIPAAAASNSPQSSLTDLLDYVPSIDLRQRGLLGTQADISIRGGSFDQNVILLNGINFTDPQTGHLNLSLPIEIDDIAKIEILSGAAGRAVGANSFSGVINFITPTDSTNRVRIQAMDGDFNLYKNSVSASINIKRLNNYLALSTMGSDGYTHNTGFNAHNLYYRGNLNLQKIWFNYQLGYTDKAFGSNGFYSLAYPDQYEENTAWLSSIGFSTGQNIKISANTYWRRLDDHYILIKSNPAAYENYHQTDVYGANAQISFNSLIGKTAIGYEFRSENIKSTRLGKITGKQEAVKKADSIFYNHFYYRNYSTIYIEQSYQYRKFRVSAGGIARIDSNQIKTIHFYPGIDLSYRLNDIYKPFISVNQSFRVPTFTDLFYIGPNISGNLNLKTEKVTNYESGIIISTPIINSTASVFYKEGRNVIDWVQYTDSTKTWHHAENITSLNTIGLELQSTLSLSKWLKNDYFYIDNLKLGYIYLNITENQDSIKSVYLNPLKHKLTTSIQIAIFKSFIANLQLVYQDREGNYETNKPYPSFVTLDAKLAWKYKWICPYIEATNITNTSYFDFNGLKLPGQWFKAGIRVDLSL